VVHGATALAAAIERKVRVEARRSARLAFESKLRDPKELYPAKRMVQELYKARNAEPKVTLTITSALVEGAGLGSSAATMLAVAGAASALEGWPTDQGSLAQAANSGEKLVHGNPSGIDVTTSAMGGVLLFKRGETPRPVEPRTPITLLVAFSGKKRNSGELISRVTGVKKSYPSLFASLCESATLVSGLSADALTRGDMEFLGRLMTYNHAVLARAGASTARLDQLVAICLSSGCLGAKLTGAGGGGSVVAVPPADLRKARTVAQGLTKKGYDTFFTKVPSGGARAWTE
jgi:mevalonate kinase